MTCANCCSEPATVRLIATDANSDVLDQTGLCVACARELVGVVLTVGTPTKPLEETR